MSRGHPTPRSLASQPGRLRERLDDHVVAVATLAAGAALQWSVADEYALLRPGWLLPTVALLLAAVLVGTGIGGDRRRSWARWARLGLVAVLTLDNAASAVLLDIGIVSGSSATLGATTLLASAAAIYLTNIIAFGVWYWELDRGGPRARRLGSGPADLLFPQMAVRDAAPPAWRPSFGDYLYVSLTNATAFSPTDTMPLTVRAKALMGLQALVALSTTVLVVARAVALLR